VILVFVIEADFTPAAPPSGRRLYRPSSVPVNLQHSELLTPAMTSLEHAASATDDEENAIGMTSLRRGSEIKLTSSIIQAAATSTVRSDSNDKFGRI